jgi:phosphatidylinositol-3-phosphatase
MRFTARVGFHALILSAVVFAVLLMGGCAGGKSSLASNQSPATATPSPTPAPSPASTPAPSPSPTPTPAPSPSPSPTPAPSPSPSPSPTPTPIAGVPHSAHVVLVIEENHTFAEVMNQMPWLVGEGDAYAFANDYHADAVGSALDYYWLSSGSSELAFGCGGWGCTNAITSDNIFRELEKAHISWKVYADSLPNAGYMGADTGAYVVRHNPAKWYSDVINSTALQQNMVPFTQLATDMAANQLPAYSIIIPDVNHDAHNGTLAAADTWLKTSVAPMLNQPYFQPGGDGLMIVTFDECDGAVGACPEQVYTAVIGPHVKPHYQSSILYKHENTLRTILDSLGITVYPGASASAADMSDFFQ